MRTVSSSDPAGAVTLGLGWDDAQTHRDGGRSRKGRCWLRGRIDSGEHRCLGNWAARWVYGVSRHGKMNGKKAGRKVVMVGRWVDGCVDGWEGGWRGGWVVNIRQEGGRIDEW